MTRNPVLLQEFGDVETISETFVMNLKQWCLICQLLAAINIPELVSAMAVFVREQ